jgi:peptidoglycan/LPS O-acetylase OafA/YrhL
LLSLLSRNRIVYPLGYNGAFDGLRGTMTIGVMVAHLRLDWYPGAVVFMDTFFVMSAYLITSLIARDVERHGRVRLAAFYQRRILRLFPAYYAMLAVFGAVALLFLHDAGAHVVSAGYAAVYFSNWARAFDWAPIGYMGHTWSLAIEEQYYLLWPLALTLLGARLGMGLRAVAVVWGAALLCAGWRAWLTLDGATPMRLYNGFDTRADALLIGCGLALLLRQPRIIETLSARRWMPVAAAMIMLLFFLLGFSIGWEDRALYLYVAFPCSVLSALLIAVLVTHRDCAAAKLLEFPPFVYLGRICYGLYLWHFPIFSVMRHDLGLSIEWVATLGVALTFVAAIASYELIEMPFLVRKNRTGSPDAQVGGRGGDLPAGGPGRGLGERVGAGHPTAARLEPQAGAQPPGP